MRVIVNQLSAGGLKTGVGYYTAQLVQHLCTRASEHSIDVYPGRIFHQAHQLWSFLAPWLEAIQRRTRRLWQNPFLALCGALPRCAFYHTYHFIRRFAERHFPSPFRGNRYDLYHEPNYIPIESDLPTVVTVHDLSVLLYPEWHPPERVARFEEAFLRGLNQCRHVLTDSEFIRGQVIRTLHLEPSRVSRVYLGVRDHLRPLSTWATASGLRRLKLPSNYLLYVGTIEPRKNIRMLLEAYCSLPGPLRERCPLLLVGQWGWKTRAVEEFYDTVARHRGVRHLGYVPDWLLPAVYNGARALVYPSFYEGFGLPPLEMLACGGAVLASNADTLVETLGGHAHLLDPNDCDGWRDALERIITDDDWHKELRTAGRPLAGAFTWGRCAADTLRVYERVGGSRPAPVEEAEFALAA